MTVPPTLPSNRLIFDIARSTREEMRAHFESADTKAGIILAFNGILIPLAKDIEGMSRNVGVVLSVLSAVIAFAGYWPRDFPIPDTVELRNYLTWPEEEACTAIGDNFLEMTRQAKAEIKKKMERLKVALALLLAAIVTFGIGVFMLPNGGESNEQQQHREPKPSPTLQQSPAPAPTHKPPRPAPSSN